MFDARVGAHVHLLRCVPENNVDSTLLPHRRCGSVSERCAHVSLNRCPLSTSDWGSSWRRDGFFLLGFEECFDMRPVAFYN